ncbi:Hypp3233 [Branchiostoma lanceolatum]|nr:Hypp3233 [Branchiostoma lanceolatum]
MLVPYQRLGAKMYKALDTAVTYDEAKAACEADGAILPTPKDMATQDRLTRHLVPRLSTSAWLGLRLDAAVEQWVWNDGEPLGGWTQWGGGTECELEPLVEWVPSISLEQEDVWIKPQIQPPMCEPLKCAYMDAEGIWYKAACDSKANGICERPVPGCIPERLRREVFRVERNSGVPVYNTWQKVGSDSWAQWNVQEVTVELFENHNSVLKLVFDGKGTDHMSWFSPDKLLSAPWTDLDRPFFFSIKGAQKTDRRFFIHGHYYGCAHDRGWLAVLESKNPPCSWERPHGYTNDDLPIILYSTLLGRVTWEQAPYDVGVADFMTVSILECP